VIPREAREVLAVRPGDKLLIVTRGDKEIVLEKPRSYRTAIRGLARGTYGRRYLEKERQSW